MNYSIYFFSIILSNVFADQFSPSFCLCALKSILEDYALMSTDRQPPRYRSSNGNDIGFYVISAQWKPVNDATWIEIGKIINHPSGIYSQISLDGIQPINNGLPLDNLRSAHLADIFAEYRFILDKVHIYHQNLIENRTKTCLDQQRKSSLGFQFNGNGKWKQVFISP